MRLARHLRSFTTEQLTRLLTARPDLLAAADAGYGALARRASSIPSVGRCLIGADVAMCIVAEALVVTAPATADEIDELLGVDDLSTVVDVLGRLNDLGLVIVEDAVVSPLPAIAELLDRPLGLGPSFAEETDYVDPAAVDELASILGAGGAADPEATARAVARRLRSDDAVDRLLPHAPPGTAELLESLLGERSSAIELPVGHLYQTISDAEPAGWLLNRGLLVSYDGMLVEPVRELVLGRHHTEGLAPYAALRPIELRTVAGLPTDAVVAAATDRATRSLEAVETLLRLIGDGEVAVRKTGGVGVREVRRLAKVLDTDAHDVGRLLQLLDAARLVRIVDGRLEPTDLAGPWGRMARHRRWLALARAWLGADGFLSVALSTDYDGKPLPALGDLGPVADAAGARRALLGTVTAIETGGAFDPAQVAEAVVWQAPNLWGPGDPPPELLVSWTLAEADVLGLIAANSPSPVLRALVAGDDLEADEAAAAALGSDQDTFVLQSDLTAMALGPLDPAVAAALGEFSDRRSDSATPVYGFDEASIRRGFDRGWTAATIDDFLSRYALSGVPQPLSYLITDVERRYGSVRIFAAGSAIVTDDEALAVEIAGTRRAARLGLRLVAPTVLVGRIEPHRLLDELRAEGFFPVLDGDIARVGPAPGDLDLSPAEETAPADWTGSSLPRVALAGEVADAVANLQADEAQDPTVTPEVVSSDHRLHLVWNRTAVVTHLSDGELRQARGVVVGVDDAVTLLNESGIERVALDLVVSVEDPSR